MTKLLRICAVWIFGALALWAADTSARKILYQETADYPAIAAKMNLHGTVKLKIWITTDGTVRRLEYIGGHPLLAEAALKAVRNWKYEPGPKESILQVQLNF